jgi:hypothetical protein
MPIELVEQFDVGVLYLFFDAVRAGTVAASSGHVSFGLLEETVVLVLLIGQRRDPLRPRAIEDHGDFISRLVELASDLQRVDHSTKICLRFGAGQNQQGCLGHDRLPRLIASDVRLPVDLLIETHGGRGIANSVSGLTLSASAPLDQRCDNQHRVKPGQRDR